MSAVELATSTPGSTIEPLDERGSAVRFEPQCVVIPDFAHRSRRPRVVTKSYALPLWKRRTSSADHSAYPPPEDASFEENQSHLVLRVPVPTFSLKLRSMARSVDEKPLPPCLVHRPQHSGPSCPTTSSLTRHARIPRKPSPSPLHSDIVTVPLRPCCAACQSVTEAALADGDAWPEHFSRAASRRRSLSADGRSRTITIAGSTASASYGDLGVSISVDEIDKRRRASDTAPSTINPETHDGKTTECRMPLILCHTLADARSPPSPTRITPATPRIPEEDDDEDEDELFPLPSPKRTPTTSPAPSPAGSLSSLTVAQVNQSSVTSPTPSTCSGDSAGQHPSKQHFLAPPPYSSCSSLSLPKLCESTTDLTLLENPPRAPSPRLLSTVPSLSGRLRTRSPSPRISCVPPTPTDTFPPATDSTLPKTPRSHEPVSEFGRITISPPPSQPSTSPHHSPTPIRFPWRSKRSVSADFSPTLSSTIPSFSPSTSPNTNRSLSSSRHVIADVLRGVGAIGSGGIRPGM
ncbi:hypothetical protein J3R82DRAFT_2865 [Butyriboletus roseoflavus]|nr:hypothetical protein J3R82DRAFT_1368 [Butyriboletus roseoflavus]KAG8220612.1 hypothetical protein J3R82DRAFT_2865 [Butyriboletus roseoflavus]